MNLARRIQKRFRREHRPRKSLPDVASPDQFLFKNGRPLAILRPADPVAKIKLFAEIPGNLPPEAYQAYCNEILQKIPHQFLGYATTDGRIVDCSGKFVDKPKEGDSFVGASEEFRPPDFMVSGRFHEEIWDGRKVLVLPRPDLKADSNTGIVLESPDATEKASIVLRPGGSAEIDCHIPTLNRIWTGDPNKDYRTMTAHERTTRSSLPPQPEFKPKG